MTARKTRSMVLAGVTFIALAVVGICLYDRYGTESPQIKAGDEVFSYLPEVVRQLTYKTGDVTVEATRAGDGPFSVRVVYTAGKAAQTCSASSDLDGNLERLSSLVARSGRVDSSAYPIALGVLDVKSDLREDSSYAVEFRKRADGATIAIYGGDAFAAEVPEAALTELEGLCAKSSRR